MMAVIVLANPKGGAGKSTIALILSTTFAEKGVNVALLDCDPNAPIVSWTSRRKIPSPITVHSDIDERNVIHTIEAENNDKDLVVVDLEGAASRLVSRAISRADMVLIPIQPSPLDSDQAIRALSLIHEEEEVLCRKIPSAVVFNRTSPSIKTRHQRAILSGLREARLTVLSTELNQRQAFQAVFVSGKTLTELDPRKVNGIEEAKRNASALTTEVYELIEKGIE